MDAGIMYKSPPMSDYAIKCVVQFNLYYVCMLCISTIPTFIGIQYSYIPTSYTKCKFVQCVQLV